MKTNFLTIAVALLLPAYCSAQSESATQKSKIQTGIYAGIAHYQPSDGFIGDQFSSLSGKQNNQYALGVSFRYQLSSRFTLLSGAGLTYKRVNISFPWLLDTTYPGYTPPLPGDWNCLPVLQQNLYNYVNNWGIDIPLLIQYYPVKNRFFISTGFELNHNIYNQYKAAFVAYNQDITYINKSEWGKGYQVILPFSCGLTFPLGKKYTVGIEPGIKLAVYSHNTDDLSLGRYTFKTSFFF